MLILETIISNANLINDTCYTYFFSYFSILQFPKALEYTFLVSETVETPFHPIHNCSYLLPRLIWPSNQMWFAAAPLWEKSSRPSEESDPRVLWNKVESSHISHGVYIKSAWKLGSPADNRCVQILRAINGLNEIWFSETQWCWQFNEQLRCLLYSSVCTRVWLLAHVLPNLLTQPGTADLGWKLNPD